jgi:RNA polymerase sigma-70 factor (ECF subfamily)
VKQKAVHLSQEAGEELIAGIRAGRERAFVQLHTEFYFPTVWFTHGITGNWMESESIVSETYEKVWLLRRNFKTIADLRAFMYVTCRNSAYNYLRDIGRQQKKEMLTGDLDTTLHSSPGYSEIDNGTENGILREEMLQKMYEQIDLLTPRRRRILQLYMQQLDTAQIAAEMGISQEAVRKAKFKAIHRIRKNLEESGLLLLLWLFMKK